MTITFFILGCAAIIEAALVLDCVFQIEKIKRELKDLKARK